VQVFSETPAQQGIRDLQMDRTVVSRTSSFKNIAADTVRLVIRPVSIYLQQLSL
jgi:hypothetical protein